MPDVLSLGIFFGKDQLCDCTVKLPDTKEGEKDGVEPVRQWQCHRVVLASASRWFYSQFILDGKTEVVIPDLPDDPIVRDTVIMEDQVPLALRYIYAAQNWDEIFPDVVDPRGLFVVACVLQIRSLADKVLAYLSETVLNTDSMMGLLYHGVQLGREGEGLVEKAGEALREDFSHICENPADADLFARLPVKTIVKILEGDELQVDSEGEVFRMVQLTLRRRSKRQEHVIVFEDIGVSDSSQFPEVRLDLSASEEPGVANPKYHVQSEPIKVEGSGQFTFPDCKLSLRIPSGPSASPTVTLRFMNSGNIVAEAVLPAESILNNADAENGEDKKGPFECALTIRQPDGSCHLQPNYQSPDGGRHIHGSESHRRRNQEFAAVRAVSKPESRYTCRSIEGRCYAREWRPTVDCRRFFKSSECV